MRPTRRRTHHECPLRPRLPSRDPGGWYLHRVHAEAEVSYQNGSGSRPTSAAVIRAIGSDARVRTSAAYLRSDSIHANQTVRPGGRLTISRRSPLGMSGVSDPTPPNLTTSSPLFPRWMSSSDQTRVASAVLAASRRSVHRPSTTCSSVHSVAAAAAAARSRLRAAVAPIHRPATSITAPATTSRTIDHPQSGIQSMPLTVLESRS